MSYNEAIMSPGGNIMTKLLDRANEKPKRRSLVERELETNMTSRVTSPVGTSRTTTNPFRRSINMNIVVENSQNVKSAADTSRPVNSSPINKMFASNSPTKHNNAIKRKITSEHNNGLSKIESYKSPAKKFDKTYKRADIIQNNEMESNQLEKQNSITKTSKPSTSKHLMNIFERDPENFGLINKKVNEIKRSTTNPARNITPNCLIGNNSVVKTLDFDSKKKDASAKPDKDKNDMLALEAESKYQIGDLAWARVGTYPFWPCIITKDPNGIFARKKLFGRAEHYVLHVTFFGDNGSRGWVADNMLRKYVGIKEFLDTRDNFTAESKKKDRGYYNAFFISEKKQSVWDTSVKEAELLLKEPKQLRITYLNELICNARISKISPKPPNQQNRKSTEISTGLTLSESLYDTLFSEDDSKDGTEKARKSRKNSLDVSEVVTACLDNMAVKSGLSQIQKQSHMDRWLQKAKSNTPEKCSIKTVKQIIPYDTTKEIKLVSSQKNRRLRSSINNTDHSGSEYISENCISDVEIKNGDLANHVNSIDAKTLNGEDERKIKSSSKKKLEKDHPLVIEPSENSVESKNPDTLFESKPTNNSKALLKFSLEKKKTRRSKSKRKTKETKSRSKTKPINKNNPKFIKYVEHKRDALLDENPNLSEDDQLEYLFKTWLYEENLKPDAVNELVNYITFDASNNSVDKSNPENLLESKSEKNEKALFKLSTEGNKIVIEPNIQTLNNVQSDIETCESPTYTQNVFFDTDEINDKVLTNATESTKTNEIELNDEMSCNDVGCESPTYTQNFMDVDDSEIKLNQNKNSDDNNKSVDDLKNEDKNPNCSEKTNSVALVDKEKDSNTDFESMNVSQDESQTEVNEGASESNQTDYETNDLDKSIESINCLETQNSKVSYDTQDIDIFYQIDEELMNESGKLLNDENDKHNKAVDCNNKELNLNYVNNITEEKSTNDILDTTDNINIESNQTTPSNFIDSDTSASILVDKELIDSEAEKDTVQNIKNQIKDQENISITKNNAEIGTECQIREKSVCLINAESKPNHEEHNHTESSNGKLEICKDELNTKLDNNTNKIERKESMQGDEITNEDTLVEMTESIDNYGSSKNKQETIIPVSPSTTLRTFKLSLKKTEELLKPEILNGNSNNSIEKEKIPKKIKTKVKTEDTKSTSRSKSINKNNPEFLQYVEHKRDALLDENLSLSEEEVLEYLFKTWLYEENVKTDIEKIDDFEQANLVKGEQENKKTRKVKKLPQIDRYMNKDKKINNEAIVQKNAVDITDNIIDSNKIESNISNEEFEETKLPELIEENIITESSKTSESNKNKSENVKVTETLDKSISQDEETVQYDGIKEKAPKKTKSKKDEIKTVSKSTPKDKESPEFLKYFELKKDAILDENPHLTEDDLLGYLYKTWLYEEKFKSDIEKTDELEQANLVKGSDDEQQALKIKKKVFRPEKNKEKVQKKIDTYLTKEKSKRNVVRAYYNEDDTDIEDEIAMFEISKNNPQQQAKPVISQLVSSDEKASSDTMKPEGNQLIPYVENQKIIQIDEQQFYLDQLLQPKPNIFKGLVREKVCEICEKIFNLVKCKGCHGTFHVDCVKNIKETADSNQEIKRKKKKKRGRKPKNASCDELDETVNSNTDENNASFELKESNIIVNLEEFETQFVTKMSEILKQNIKEPLALYSPSSCDWTNSVPGKCEIIDLKSKPKTIEVTNFKCHNCQKYDMPVCFVCKSAVSPKNKVEYRQRCQVPHCFSYYHLECLDFWPQTQFNAGELTKCPKSSERFEAITCPRHVCHTCVCDDPRGCKTRFSSDKLAKCVRCPATYHSFNKCLPAGSQVLSASYIICPRHYQNKPGKVPCHVNTGWCFICALGGTLICCEYCPTSFHAECLNIKPPEGSYMCEDCETGRLPLYGEMVWVKLGHYRWWPGVVLHPCEIPENILAVKHSLGEFVVRFFGQYDYYWVNRGRVFPFQEGDSGRVSSQKSKVDEAFTIAITHAKKAFDILKAAPQNSEEDTDIASSLLPPHYVKLKVNKPVGSLTNRRTDEDDCSLTQCECKPNEQEPCGMYSQCLNRMLLTECGPICRAGDMCRNRAFERREYPRLVPYRTPQRGWGLKTLQDIRQGEFVIEYVGELIDEAEFQRRMIRKHEIRDENYYFLTLDKDRMIDAGPKGNLARFMNHCCEPNCETQKWTVLGDVRVGLFALYDIPANSEVTFNYNLECAGIEKKRCMCGARRCSGYIGAKPKQDDAPPKKLKLNNSQTKRTYKKRKPTETPSPTIKKKNPRAERSRTKETKSKELTEIEKDLLIIKMATSAADNDCKMSLVDIEKSLKRKLSVDDCPLVSKLSKIDSLGH